MAGHYKALLPLNSDSGKAMDVGNVNRTAMVPKKCQSQGTSGKLLNIYILKPIIASFYRD